MGSADLHEVILTRGDVQGLEESLRNNIFVAENCALVHTGACHQKAHTREGQLACVLSILEFHNFEDVLAWLSGAIGHVPMSMFNKALDLVGRAEMVRSNE